MALFTPKTCLLMIPRTATTWCRDAIRAARPKTSFGRMWYWESNPKHRAYNPLGGTTDPRNQNWTGRVVFSFVRHPVTWLRSRWCLGPWDDRRGHASNPGDAAWYFDPFTDIYDADFPTFVERYLTEKPGEIGRNFRRYTQECSHVGHQETAVEDLIRILTEAGEQFDEAAIRGLSPTNYSETYPEYAAGQAERVCDAEADVMAEYGYTREWSDLPVHRSQERVISDYLSAETDIPQHVRDAMTSLLAKA